jgi:hypothetical protein
MDQPENPQSKFPQNSDASPRINADDLLSQLAGKEIERLLAQVDADLRPALDHSAGQVRPLSTLALRIYQNPAGEPALQLEPLDLGLLENLQPAPQRRQLPHRPAPLADDEMLAVLGDLGTSPEERDGLDGPLDNVLASGDAEGPDVSAAPAYIKPLVWINAPFTGLSEQALRFIGGAAVVSFVSAVVALTYILAIL